MLLLWVLVMPDADAGTAPAGLSARRPDGGSELLAATQTEVEIEINGMVARATLRQRFINPLDVHLEGQYRLPLPADAAVYAMRIELDGRVIEGVIREREAARIEYEAARSAGMATALVEQQKLDLFATRVANIPPHAEVRVELEYFQSIGFHDGRFGLALPLTIRPRYGDSAADDFAALLEQPQTGADVAGATLPITLKLRLVAGVPVLVPESPSHRIRVRRREQSFEIELADVAVMPDRDFVLTWRPQPGAVPSLASFRETIDGDTYLSVMVVPPTERGARLPRELVIVLDSSGSMTGPAFEAAQQAARSALARLGAGDWFNIVDFDSSAIAFQPASLPVNAANIAAAEAFVSRLQADGGTEIAGALRLAQSLPAVNGHLRQIVFITDGAVGNEGAIYQQLAQTDDPARLFMVGIGAAPNRAFLRRAAELGRGVATVIDANAEIDQALIQLFRRIESPQLGDVRIQWPEGAESYPQRVPDLFAGEPLWLTTRIGADATAANAAIGLKARAPTGTLDALFPLAQSSQARGIAKLWARRKIAALEDGIALGDNAEQVRKEVLATALAHGLLSSQTSFVAVEKRVRRGDDEAMARAEFANPAPADQVGFAQTALGWRLQLLFAAGLAALSMLFRRAARG
ncbi:MAG: marine proteobacterial sortase target protein [Xanthomonadales bacterium]|nr:marine proteobacterial sortase target protein [Xanthomonadales bacterium]